MTNKQLDRHIAEKVMGMTQDEGGYNLINGEICHAYRPSTKVAQAIQALEVFLKKGWRFNSCYMLHWSVWIDDMNGKEFKATNKSLALAICEALVQATTEEER